MYEIMLHNKVNILLRDAYATLVGLPPAQPNNSVVTGFWLVLRWEPQFFQCLVLFEAVYELTNPLFPN